MKSVGDTASSERFLSLLSGIAKRLDASACGPEWIQNASPAEVAALGLASNTPFSDGLRNRLEKLGQVDGTVGKLFKVIREWDVA